ncbi:hypothetical protein RND71_025506 [Anisodus tanguticus]|uniref:Putative plant transposon protein domain-containing protein n=1 Tax=Anisodus tanguticus TaxID=243964 RepID=A0AAE1RRW3_9SOLA|nr:hypothetical protein RND71_025506 [Anisodus tanguticus]
MEVQRFFRKLKDFFAENQAISFKNISKARASGMICEPQVVHQNPEDHRVWAASVIAKETLDRIDPTVGIQKNTLKNEAKFWLRIISSRVLSSFNDTNITLEKVIMIIALMTRSRINVEEIIQDNI